MRELHTGRCQRISYKISNLKSQIGRSHLRNFPQKCDRSYQIRPSSSCIHLSVLELCVKSVLCGLIIPMQPELISEEKMDAQAAYKASWMLYLSLKFV